VGTKQPSSRPHRLHGNFHKGSYSPSGFKSDELGNRSQGRRAAEGTVLEIRLAPRMVMMPLVRGSAAGVGRTEFHQERCATRGHEPNGDIGTKDQRGQQYDGHHIGSPSVTQPSLHDCERHHARVSVIVPVGTSYAGSCVLLRQCLSRAAHLCGQVLELRLAVFNGKHGFLIVDMNARVEPQLRQHSGVDIDQPKTRMVGE
jgi:hypothetical protein